MKNKSSVNQDRVAKSINEAIKEIVPISDIAKVTNPKKGLLDLIGKDGGTVATIRIEVEGTSKAKKAIPAKSETAKSQVKKQSAKTNRTSPGKIRLVRYWGVFNQKLKRVAVFEYGDRKLADKKGAELSVSTKQPHFVQLVKEIKKI